MPKNSTSQTAIINTSIEGMFFFLIALKSYFVGLNVHSCARLFDLDPSSLFKAQKKEGRKMENMKLPPVPRDKLENQYELLTKYFDSIPPKSGTFNSYFTNFY